MSEGQEVSESLTSTDGLPLLARPYRLDYGKCNYAAVTFSNCPQRIMLGWGEDWNEARRNNARDYFGKMTIPRQLSLCKIKGRYLVSQKPVVCGKVAASRQRKDILQKGDIINYGNQVTVENTGAYLKINDCSIARSITEACEKMRKC
ncbi:MAG: hypothetical protein J6L77_02060 [Coprococcus sp.]|nr:hypothetical protein [Coprococcus sp.]